jgi:hypothetical protein
MINIFRNNAYSIYPGSFASTIIDIKVNLLEINFINGYMRYEDLIRRAIELLPKRFDFSFAAVIVRRATGEIIVEEVSQSVLNSAFQGEMVAINQCAELHRPAD